MTKKKYFTKNAKRLAKNAAQRRCNPGWYKRHKDEILKKTAVRAKSNKAKYGRLVYISRRRNVEITLSFEEYEEVVSQPCFYCGGPLNRIGHSLDRINPKAGYVHGNVRPCCKRCNIAKNDMTELEFHYWLLRVVNHWRTS